VDSALSDTKKTKKRRQRWDTRVLSGRMSPGTYEAVIKVVESGNYVDVTDYLRDIVRKDLKARGISLESP
jgi:Arc/MetJ-type ribon-helix-helix transcriptional regulator